MKHLLHNKFSVLMAPEDGGSGGAGGQPGSFVTPPSTGSPAPGTPPGSSAAPGAGTTPPPGNSGTPPASGGDGNTSWKSTLPKELQENATLGKFTSVEALARSYVDAQKLIMSEKIPVPTSATTPEQWQEIYKKLGLPETIDKYEVKFAEGSTIDAEFTKAFKENAHKVGILPSQAQALADWFSKENAQTEATFQAELKKRFEAGAEELKKEWGNSYELNLSRANKVLADEGGEEIVKHIQELGIQGDHKLFKFLAKVGAKLYSEHKFVEGQGTPGAMSPKEIQAKITALQADPAYFDKNNAKHKVIAQEVQDLFEQLYPTVDKR